MSQELYNILKLLYNTCQRQKQILFTFSELLPKLSSEALLPEEQIVASEIINNFSMLEDSLEKGLTPTINDNLISMFFESKDINHLLKEVKLQLGEK